MPHFTSATSGFATRKAERLAAIAQREAARAELRERVPSAKARFLEACNNAPRPARNVTTDPTLTTKFRATDATQVVKPVATPVQAKQLAQAELRKPKATAVLPARQEVVPSTVGALMQAVVKDTDAYVDTLTYRQLQKVCGHYGLRAVGKTEVLRERIKSAGVNPWKVAL